MYVCLVETDQKIILMTNREFAITSFESEAKGLEHFESSYRRHRSMGHEGSMSVAINMMFFRPSIVKINGDSMDECISDMTARFIGIEDISKVHTIAAQNIAGSMHGLLCESPNIRTEFEAGAKPNPNTP